MGALTEAQIFDCLTTNLKLAAEHCEDLAKLPAKGPTYRKLRDELKLIEGSCKQASAWREDTRWLNIGLMMGEAHKRAGDWLRGIKTPTGARVKIAEGQLHPLFLALAENLRACAKLADQYRTRATGRVGMILPTPQPAPLRTQGRPMQVLLPSAKPRVSPGGIILPPGTPV